MVKMPQMRLNLSHCQQQEGPSDMELRDVILDRLDRRNQLVTTVWLQVPALLLTGFEGTPAKGVGYAIAVD